jgi:DNA (cytosine-5)-methyltransferase 1
MCSGFAGLEMGAAEVLDIGLAWVADPDPGAAAVLAHHHPDVPNLGDITAVDWASAEPVDVICAGFPCQDISYAGRGAGIVEGTRSGLWHTIADALGVLRPRLVVLENVAAIVARRPGLDVVLADLARLGFDAEWTCLRASDVGAPHQRNRWFLLARPADADRPGLEGPRLRWATPQCDLSPADTAGDGRREGRAEPAGLVGRSDVALSGLSAFADTDSDTLRQQPVPEPGRGGASVSGLPCVEWGPYEPAIRRWERVVDRPAPRPTEPGRTGERLSPRFVEWLMGITEGHVTDVPGISRNAQLRLLGNGVVPQQGASALSFLLGQAERAA